MHIWSESRLRVQIRRHYLSHGFFWDLFATVPLDLMMWGLSNSFSRYPPDTFGILSPQITQWLRIPKMLLVLRFLRWQKTNASRVNRNLLTVLQHMVPALFLLLHIYTCLWWMCGSFMYWDGSAMTYNGRSSTSDAPLPYTFRAPRCLSFSGCCRFWSGMDEHLHRNGAQRRFDRSRRLRHPVHGFSVLGSSNARDQRLGARHVSDEMD